METEGELLKEKKRNLKKGKEIKLAGETKKVAEEQESSQPMIVMLIIGESVRPLGLKSGREPLHPLVFEEGIRIARQ